MKQTVLLVQRGISSQTHPISGKSLKHYGTAVQSPSHGGVVFKMDLAAYAEAAHDLIGNTVAGQQWVPEIIYEADGVSRGRCCIPAGCQREADYQFGSDLYCAGHAPNNATALYPGAPPIGTGNLSAGFTPDVLPTVVEKPPTLVEKGQQQQLPVEVLKPAIGTAEEGVSAAKPIPIEKPVSIPSASDMPAASAPLEPTPTVAPTVAFTAPAPEPAPKAPHGAPEPSATVPGPDPAEKQRQAIAVISDAVIEKALPALEARLETLVGDLAAKLLASTNGKKPQKKRTGGPDLATTAFRVLQRQAKDLGINTFQLSAAALKAAITEKQKTPAT